MTIILVADDEPLVAMALEAALEDVGYEVVTHNKGGSCVVPEDPQICARITAALCGLEAAKPLAGGDLLSQTSNAELLDIENWVALILRRFQTAKPRLTTED